MWRWVIRIYVAFIVFLVLMFFSGMIFIKVERLLIRVGYPSLSRTAHEHPLAVIFLIGFAAGHLYLGSNFTGRGWFRSKSGLTYEGFKLEALKPWSWAIVSPVLLMGIAFWFQIQREDGTFAQIAWQSFYDGFLMPNCSNRRFFAISGDAACSVNLMFLGMWVASIGYSLAPIARKRVLRIFNASGTAAIAKRGAAKGSEG